MVYGPAMTLPPKGRSGRPGRPAASNKAASTRRPDGKPAPRADRAAPRDGAKPAGKPAARPGTKIEGKLSPKPASPKPAARRDDRPSGMAQARSLTQPRVGERPKGDRPFKIANRIPTGKPAARPAPTPAQPREDGREGERIAKLLARAGVASRREVERLITEGRVRLNDELVTTPATILKNLKGVSVDGRLIAAAAPTRVFRFHKPAGLITAERDPSGRPTIYNALRNALPPETPRVMPVGRLDLNTEGLLLLTNDGELKRALELPATGIPRTYRARTFGDISQDRLEELIEGIEIEGVRYGQIDANMERRTGRNQWIEMTLTEGKNREVRRVLEHLGLQVSRLLRIAYGPFELADLPRGGAEEVPQVLVERFRKTLKTSPAPTNFAQPKSEN